MVIDRAKASKSFGIDYKDYKDPSVVNSVTLADIVHQRWDVQDCVRSFLEWAMVTIPPE